jgi:hypothetical protein
MPERRQAGTTNRATAVALDRPSAASKVSAVARATARRLLVTPEARFQRDADRLGHEIS